MKMTGNLFLFFSALLFSACVMEKSVTEYDPVPETRGVVSIVVTDQSNDPADQIKTIRFIVFKDIAANPRPDVNEFRDESFFTGSGDASQLTALLEVSRKTSGPNTKRVFVIVNEPAQLTAALDAVTGYNELQNLELDFAHFLNTTQTALQNGKGLPMTGIVETDKVYATPVEAQADAVSLTLERAVARVDVYIRKQAGCAVDMKAGSEIQLGNSYDKGDFIRNQIAPHTNLYFGRIQTVAASGFKDYSYTVTSATAIPVLASGNDGHLICSFYTPERTCTTDPLTVTFDIKSSDNDDRSGTIQLDTAIPAGAALPTPLTEIRRNNSYKVIGTVEKNTPRINFSIVYKPWEVKEQNITFD